MGKCEESAEFLLYWKNNASVLGPDFLQTADCPPPEWIPLLTIAIVLWVATVIVTQISACRFNSYRWTKTFIHVMSTRVLYFYVVYSLLQVVTILNSKGTILYQYLGDVVESLCFVNLYMLVWSYTGGIEETLKKMIGLELNLGQPPLCCLRCLPNIKITHQFIKNMERLLLQLPATQFVVGLINVTLISAGISATLFEHWSTTLLYIILTISFMMSMYAIGVLFACWSQFVLGRNVRAKFIVFKVTIVLQKVQEAILRLCKSKVEKSGYYSDQNRIDMWAAFMVCAECLLLSIAASFLYKKSDYDVAHSSPIRYKKDTDELENGMEEVDLGKPSLVIQNPNV